MKKKWSKEGSASNIFICLSHTHTTGHQFTLSIRCPPCFAHHDLLHISQVLCRWILNWVTSVKIIASSHILYTVFFRMENDQPMTEREWYLEVVHPSCRWKKKKGRRRHRDQLWPGLAWLSMSGGLIKSLLHPQALERSGRLEPCEPECVLTESHNGIRFCSPMTCIHTLLNSVQKSALDWCCLLHTLTWWPLAYTALTLLQPQGGMELGR